ncbi:MAG: GerMN domain-containing protein [Blastocatellia bacterium]
MKIVFGLLICVILLNAATFNAEARPAKKEVRIYLVNDCSSNDTWCLEPVSRMVDNRSPALGALKALIAGPTAEEKSKGLTAPYTEYLSVKRLVITRGTAQVSLRTTRKGWPRWPGDMAPERFTVAIEKTLKQFPNVRRVTICLDGYADFASERGGPRKRCN